MLRSCKRLDISHRARASRAPATRVPQDGANQALSHDDGEQAISLDRTEMSSFSIAVDDPQVFRLTFAAGFSCSRDPAVAH
jgi:hypothetical protein